jgi:hypothetical protein
MSGMLIVTGSVGVWLAKSVSDFVGKVAPLKGREHYIYRLKLRSWGRCAFTFSVP